LKTLDFYKDRFISKVSIILLGTIMGQVLAFLSVPFIARTYGPEVLGRAASVLALLNVLSMISCLQYDQAIIISEDKDKFHLVFACILFSLIIGGGLALFSNGIASLSNDYVSAQEIRLLSLLLILYSSFLVSINYRLRDNALKLVSIGRTIYYGGSSLLQAGTGFLFGGTCNSFLLAQAFCLAIGIILLFPARDFVKEIQAVRPFEFLKSTLLTMRRHVNFPRYQMGAALVNSFTAQLPVLFLRVMFSESWAGWYFMAYRILAAPMSLLSQAIGQIFYRDSAERERQGGERVQNVENISVALSRISYLPAVTFALIAPYAIRFLLGDEWAITGQLMQILLLGLVFSFIVSPLSPLLSVKGKQREALILNIVLSALKILGLFIGWLMNSAFVSIILMTVGSAVGMVIFFAYLLRSIGSDLMRFVWIIKAMLLDGLFIVVVGTVVSLQNVHHVIKILALTSLLAIGLYREYLRTRGRRVWGLS
jgi:O-antigen/teichoic acid export membrane protein